MSGVAVVTYLLVNNAPLLVAMGAGPPVASSRIMAGDLPLKTVRPAIGVTQIDSIPTNLLRINEGPRVHTDRVQVAVLVNGSQNTPAGLGYRGVRTLLRLLAAACPSQYGVINGIMVHSITPDIEGPDLYNDVTDIYGGSRDFMVRWSE